MLSKFPVLFRSRWPNFHCAKDSGQGVRWSRWFGEGQLQLLNYSESVHCCCAVSRDSGMFVLQNDTVKEKTDNDRFVIAQKVCIAMNPV